MKISEDQNTMTMSDGVVLKAVEVKVCCDYCYFYMNKVRGCSEAPCEPQERIDRRRVVFMKAQNEDK